MKNTMLIVGQVTSAQEAEEMEFIAKVFVVAWRFKQIALEVKK